MGKVRVLEKSNKAILSFTNCINSNTRKRSCLVVTTFQTPLILQLDFHDVGFIVASLLSETISADEHAVVVWGGAGFHRSKELIVPKNMTQLQFPTSSPELNPIENLWRYLKSHFWSNRVYVDFNALMDATETAWKKACLDTELMKTVCNAPYAEHAAIY